MGISPSLPTDRCEDSFANEFFCIEEDVILKRIWKGKTFSNINIGILTPNLDLGHKSDQLSDYAFASEGNVFIQDGDL